MKATPILILSLSLMLAAQALPARAVPSQTTAVATSAPVDPQRLAARELRGEGADEAVAGACRIDGLDLA